MIGSHRAIPHPFFSVPFDVLPKGSNLFSIEYGVIEGYALSWNGGDHFFKKRGPGQAGDAFFWISIPIIRSVSYGLSV